MEQSKQFAPSFLTGNASKAGKRVTRQYTERAFHNEVLNRLSLLAIQDKIIRWELVDNFSLLYREFKKKHKEELDEKKKEKLRKRKVDRTWGSCLLGFFIYTSISTRAQP